MSLKGRVFGALGAWVLTEGRVTAVTPLSARLRRVAIGGLPDAPFVPGDRVQLVVGSDTRTYTPTRWSGGATELLVFSHGDGPGAAWGRAVAPGDRVRFAGPQRSIRVDGPVVVFGDETAFGLAEALGAFGVFEVSDRDAAAAFLTDHPGVAIPVDGDRHYDAVVDALAARGIPVVFAGRSRSIQEVRRRWLAAGRAAPAGIKPYWADGRTGLD